MAQRRLRWVKKEFLPWNIKKTEGKGGKNDDDAKKKIEDLERKRQEALDKNIAETQIMLDEDFKIDFKRRDNVVKKLKDMKEVKKKGKQNSLYDTTILKFMIEQQAELRLVTEMKLLLVIAYLEAA